MRRGDRHLPGHRRAQLMQSVLLVVPGRKTDVKDAQWLCQLLEAGLLKPSFVPPKPIRTLRNLTRYRKTQINDRQRESSRLHKILEDTGIKLGCVATDILGKSGRDMLDALVTGTTDATMLAELARGKLRAKIPALKEALEGRFDSEHALIVSQILAHLDFLDEAIDRLSAEIEERIAPFARERDLLMTIPGLGRLPPDRDFASGSDRTQGVTPVPHGARLCFGGELRELLHRGGDDLALAFEAVGVRFGDFDVDADQGALAMLLEAPFEAEVGDQA